MNDNFVRRNLKRRFKGTYKKKRKTNKGGVDGASEAFTGKKGTGSSYAYHIERNDNSNNGNSNGKKQSSNEAPSLGLDPLKVRCLFPYY